ncbi:MAG: GxxExxY protein [Candidatus Marinimicrobia bacterium]|nr:GxxExxY protein [Candidatus Neomarinimicrobiota bacterium]
MNENNIASIIADCAYQIHIKTGPGMFESVYECILEEYLLRRGLLVKRQVKMPIQFENITLNRAFVADMVVNDMVIIELKSKSKLTDTDKKQLLTYLKLTGYKLGLLINFGDALIKDGIRRIINGTIE